MCPQVQTPSQPFFLLRLRKRLKHPHPHHRPLPRGPRTPRRGLLPQRPEERVRARVVQPAGGEGCGGGVEEAEGRCGGVSEGAGGE